MDGDHFADFISRERERLSAEREAVLTQQQELEQRLDAVNREFKAIEAYETAKTGKAASSRQGRKAVPQSNARRGSKREELIRIIRESDGLSRGEILERMGLKGNKQGEMSVSNALTALTKVNQIRRTDDRKYLAA